MAPQVEYEVLKASDRDFFNALVAISDTTEAKELRVDSFRLTPQYGPSIEFKKSEIDTETDKQLLLEKILSANAKSFRMVHLSGPAVSIYFQRRLPQHKPPSDFDLFNIELTSDLPDKETGIIFIANALACVSHLGTENAFKLFGESEARLYQAREVSVLKLEQIARDNLKEIIEATKQQHSQLAELRSQLESEFQERRAQLESAFKERNKELDDSIADKRNSLAKKWIEFRKAKDELDDAAPMIARRRLQDQIQKGIAERKKKFSLSPTASKRRIWVLGAYVALLGSLGFVLWNLLKRDPFSLGGNSVVDWFLLTKQSVVGVVFFATFGLMIRWMNHWSEIHAEAELQNLKVDTDMLRASWLVEAVFEAKDNEQVKLPPELINTLSANLFDHNEGKSAGALTAGEIILQLLAKSSIEVTPGGFKLGKK